MSHTDKFDKEDYYLSEEGFIVFTEKYHLKRGYCCQSNCRHCPWKDKEKGLLIKMIRRNKKSVSKDAKCAKAVLCDLSVFARNNIRQPIRTFVKIRTS